MELKGKVALFTCSKTSVDIVDMATGQVVQQHDAQGTHNNSTDVQKNVAAIAVSAPQHGVHVMDLKSGKVLCKFLLPNGKDARVSLSKDTLTLVVVNDTGMR